MKGAENLLHLTERTRGYQMYPGGIHVHSSSLSEIKMLGFGLYYHTAALPRFLSFVHSTVARSVTSGAAQVVGGVAVDTQARIRLLSLYHLIVLKTLKI
jgi:hypothetical protein